MTVNFGPFILLRRLAVTGLAEVFLAKRRSDSVEVAVKRLLPHAQEDDEIVSLFLSEAELARSLRHPNVVKVHDTGQVGNSTYLEQEYLEGLTLSQLARALRESDESLSEEEVVAIASQLGLGLDYIHNVCDHQGQPRGVVHRDLTPGNIMLTANGEVRILDFGIATYRGRTHLTQPGIRKGKVAYMSPEQVRGDALDFRSDVFALGIVLTELLTGDRLFKDDDVLRTMERVESADLPEPTGSESEFSLLLRRCLSRLPLDRPSLRQEVLTFCESYLRERGLGTTGLLKSAHARAQVGDDRRPGVRVSRSLPLSAEERGEETTDQKEDTDITLYGDSPFPVMPTSSENPE